MEIRYKNTKIEKLINNEAKLQKKYGEQAKNKIKQRMQELDAAENLADMPPAAKTHPNEPKNKGKFSVDILKHQHSLRLLFYADGEFDLNNITSITIINIHEISKIHS